MADILLNNDDKTYYDFNIIDGDFELTTGFETALLMSLFCEKRADASEMPAPELRRGWWGNTMLGYENYEIGSKLWLLEQARKDSSSLNLSKTYAQDGLQWLIIDGHAQAIKTDASFTIGGIDIEIEIKISLNEILISSYKFWQDTVTLS